MKTAPERFRALPSTLERLGFSPTLASDESFGNNGMFFVPFKTVVLRCMVSDGMGWDHVSVSLPKRASRRGRRCAS